jgi:hypothetical protein
MAKKKPQSEKPPEKLELPVKIERFTQTLMVALKAHEVAERAERAAHLVSDQDHLKEEYKLIRDAHKTRLSELNTEHRKLSSEVREKVTMREVGCERHFIYATKVVRDIRADTGEVLMERPMSDVESQRELDFPDGGSAPGSAGKSGGDVDDEFDNEEE